MTHAERIREAERKVLQLCRDWAEYRGGVVSGDIQDETVALFALESQTCPKCGGTGGTWGVFGHGELGEWITCPAGCDNGRKRN